MCDLKIKKIKMGYFILLFNALFFSCLFINMKISTIISLLAFKSEETEHSAKISLLIMIIAIFFIALFFTIY